MRASLSRHSQPTRSYTPRTIHPRAYLPLSSPIHQTSFHIHNPHPGRASIHSTSRSYDSDRRSWIHRNQGMRGRLRALADSIGLTSQDEPRPITEETVGEELYVMPGWAVVKRRFDSSTALAVNLDSTLVPFDLHLSISGYCSLARPASLTTRTQRVMVSLVRRFAALPSLPGTDPDHQPMGPLPAAVGMAFMEEAEEDSKKAAKDKEVKTYAPYVSKRRAAHLQEQPGPSRIAPSRQSSQSSIDTHFSTNEAVTTAHDNLHTRLAPFWSNILPNRRVLFDVYAYPPGSDPKLSPDGPSNDLDKHADSSDHPDPLYSFQLITDANGHFSKTIVIPWERICSTPSTVAAAFKSTSEDYHHALLGWDLRLRSRLDYEDLPIKDDERSYRERLRRAMSSYGVDAVDEQSTQTRNREEAEEKVLLNDPKEPQVVEWTSIRVGREDGVHVISDLDDTVKHSDILSGPREVFRNVFCRPLTEICVPEMDAMYRRLEERGVQGFHFVSNSPSQLFPSIRRFLTVNAFPSRHSIKLKYYGGRSIFSSLYDSPAGRKRTSLTDLFEAFPQATVVMLGDSAEQDLELYVEFAQKYPKRVGAIAIRDVTSDRATAIWRDVENLVDRVQSSLTISPSLSEEPSLIRQETGQAPGTIQPPNRPGRASSVSSNASEEELRTLTSSQQKILHRAALWETRMEKARRDVPQGVKLYFYKNPLDIEQNIVDIIESNS